MPRVASTDLDPKCSTGPSPCARALTAAQEGLPCGGDGARGRRGAAQDDVHKPMGRAEEEAGSEGMRCASLVVPPRAYARVVYENRRCGVHALSRPRIGLYHTRNIHSADGTSPRTMVGGTERARCIDPCYVASHVLCDVTTYIARHQSARRPPRRIRYLGTTAQRMRTASPFITRPGAVVCRAPFIVCVNSARSREGDRGRHVGPSAVPCAISVFGHRLAAHGPLRERAL